MTKETTIVIECPKCNATGLYVGQDERMGAAIICPECKGTGKQKITYKKFTGRKETCGIKRVFAASFGCVHYGEDFRRKYDKKTLHFSRYGCTYEDWKKGKEPIPMEELYCPWRYYDLDHNSEFYSRCEKSCEGAKFVCPSNCQYCFTFEECWKEWHKLYG